MPLDVWIIWQVRFALSSSGSWANVDGLFSTRDFYDAIVEWFEGAEEEDDCKFVEDLLLWWSK
jgi:hypothetical protein